MKAMMTVVAGVVFSSILTAQSTMNGRPAEPYATDGVFVLRQFTVKSGEGYGTMTRVAILTHAAWLKIFNGRPDAIGMTLRGIGTSAAPSAVIVGVLPSLTPQIAPELDPSSDMLILSPDLLQPSFGTQRTYAPIVRLAPGVSVWQIHASMATAIAGLSASIGGEPGTALRLDTLRQK